MKLHNRIITLLSTVMLIAIAAVIGIQYLVVFPAFHELEHQAAERDIQRCREAIEREIDHLSMLCKDWAEWDDTYQFVQGQLPDYIVRNGPENPDWYTETDLNLIHFHRTDGTLFWGRAMEPQGQQPITLADFPSEGLPADHFMLRVTDDPESSVRGIMLTEIGLLIVASRPILTSEYTGPRMGVLIMGRRLDSAAVEKLAGQTRVDFTIWPVDDPAIPHDDLSMCREATDRGAVLVGHIDKSVHSLYTAITGIDGRPALYLKANMPRTITAKGRVAIQFAAISALLVGLTILLTLLLTLRRIVIKPVTRLTEHAMRIGRHDDLTSRLDMNRRDEIGLLAKEFDAMVGQLAESRAQLMDASRHAGQAEIATGVIHDIGNILTNINVQTRKLTDRVRQSQAPNLTRVAALINDHTDDLSVFLTSDDSGRHLAEYLSRLGEHVAQETDLLLQDLAGLDENLRHIANVICAQQAYAKASDVAVRVTVDELAHALVTAVDASFQHHGVALDVQVADLPPITIDRAKVIHVVANLLVNAKDAVKAMPPDRRHVTLMFRRKSENRLEIEISDTGVGIEPCNLTRLFSHGFTTKQGGHGFGLHFSALAAKEMGGSLTAKSAGPGQGATFTLELPLTSDERVLI